jgi:hypothetical protein
MNKHTSPQSLSIKDNHKYKEFEGQIKKEFSAHYCQPKTKLIIPNQTDICPISKPRAGFYTANPELFPVIVEPSNTIKL